MRQKIDKSEQWASKIAAKRQWLLETSSITYMQVGQGGEV